MFLMECHFIGAAARAGVAIRDLERAEISSVNFVYNCTDGEHDLVLKANLFGRSMLYAFEMFQDMGESAFLELLKNKGQALSLHEVVREKAELEILRSCGVSVPAIRHFIYPNVMLLDRIRSDRMQSVSCKQSAQLAKSIALIHEAKVPLHLAGRKYICTDSVLVVNDSNFNEPVVLKNVSDRVKSLVQSFSRHEELLHGDFKENNLIRSGDRIVFIDPKLCVGTPYADIGKYILRVIFAPTRVSSNAYRELQSFIRAYAQERGFDARETEEASILCGVIELTHLLSKPQRPHTGILGSEMIELYKKSGAINHLNELVLRGSEKVSVETLTTFLDRHQSGIR